MRPLIGYPVSSPKKHACGQPWRDSIGYNHTFIYADVYVTTMGKEEETMTFGEEMGMGEVKKEER